MKSLRVCFFIEISVPGLRPSCQASSQAAQATRFPNQLGGVIISRGFFDHVAAWTDYCMRHADSHSARRHDCTGKKKTHIRVELGRKNVGVRLERTLAQWLGLTRLVSFVSSGFLTMRRRIDKGTVSFRCRKRTGRQARRKA